MTRVAIINKYSKLTEKPLLSKYFDIKRTKGFPHASTSLKNLQFELIKYFHHPKKYKREIKIQLQHTHTTQSPYDNFQSDFKQKNSPTALGIGLQ